MFKYIISVALLLVGFNSLAMPKVGEMAPDIQMDEFSLKDAKGKIVVLYFYPRDNTSNCTTEAKAFAEYHAELEKLGAVVVGVSSGSQQMHRQFKETNNLPFALISDEQKTIIKQYDVSGFIWSQRATFLIDREGKIAYIWRSVNVNTHAQEVIKKIEELKL